MKRNAPLCACVCVFICVCSDITVLSIKEFKFFYLHGHIFYFYILFFFFYLIFNITKSQFTKWMIKIRSMVPSGSPHKPMHLAHKVK